MNQAPQIFTIRSLTEILHICKRQSVKVSSENAAQ